MRSSTGRGRGRSRGSCDGRGRSRQPAGRRETLESLERVGLVDDGRYAAARAAALAQRGYGDAAIRWKLERSGVASSAVAEALAALEPEAERVQRLTSGRSARPASLRLLARRGFGEEAVEAARRALGVEEPGSVG